MDELEARKTLSTKLKMNIDLREAVSANFGFGILSSVILLPCRGSPHTTTFRNCRTIFLHSQESMLYHISHNRLIITLALFALPLVYCQFSEADYVAFPFWDVDAHRGLSSMPSSEIPHHEESGVVAIFKRDRFDRYSNFCANRRQRVLGRKGRGLAFINYVIKKHPEFEEFENASVAIPRL